MTRGTNFQKVGEISCQSVSVRAKHIWQAELPEGQLNDQNKGGCPMFQVNGDQPGSSSSHASHSIAVRSAGKNDVLTSRCAAPGRC